jgi:alkanesulfonate monooxygenase SsuD/methylene tetrahydromethanopterin reductase-like flavin-dependent oxidoreductase (luciferase family)
MESLELWTSLTWLASHTSRIEFGPLVTPFSFRHPVFTARMGKDVHALSDGRLILGVGAGWQAREHEMFGFELLPVQARFDRFEEGVEVVARMARESDRVDFEGRFYHLRDAALLPRPDREGGPTLLVGGNGRNRTLPLAAKWGEAWNGVFLTAEDFGSRNRRLDDLLKENDRMPSGVHRSLMTNLIFGRDGRELDSKLEGRQASAAELRADGRIVGTPDEVIDQLHAYESQGAERVMLQWLDLDDLEGISNLAGKVLPEFS